MLHLTLKHDLLEETLKSIVRKKQFVSFVIELIETIKQRHCRESTGLSEIEKIEIKARMLKIKLKDSTVGFDLLKSLSQVNQMLSDCQVLLDKQQANDRFRLNNDTLKANGDWFKVNHFLAHVEVH
jgi:hypothetical protein